MSTPAPAERGEGRLFLNLIHFARALRAAGLPVGPGQTLDAVRAVETVGIGDRGDFYWTLHAVFVSRRDHRELFDQTFHVFWRNPRILERMQALLLPRLRGSGAQDDSEPLRRRVAEALFRAANDDGSDEERTKIEIDASLTWSREEALQHKDFEEMSAAEIEAAKRAVRRMSLSMRPVATRRFRADPAGSRISMRRSLRATVRSGGDTVTLVRKAPRLRLPPLVVLCDISGSMSRYSRMLLHFMHAVTTDRDRVSTFVFGTRLTNISRHLREKDADIALARVSDAVNDWEGGTRIGECLRTFNREWSRRVLSQGAIVLFISDGLDRDAGSGLEGEMDRLRRSSRKILWLNPLLRYEDFEPRAAGVRTILPYVDRFLPAHNLSSLSQLADLLARGAESRRHG